MLFVSCQVFGMDKEGEEGNPISFSISLLGQHIMQITYHTRQVSMNVNCIVGPHEYTTRLVLEYVARNFPGITLPDQMVQEINQKYAAAYTDNPTEVIDEICAEACELVKIIYYLYTLPKSNLLVSDLIGQELTLNGSNLKLTPSIDDALNMTFTVHDTKRTPNRGMFGTVTQLNNGLRELNLRKQQQQDFIVRVMQGPRVEC